MEDNKLSSGVSTTYGAPAPVTVFYDGSCPLCAREVAFYRRRRGGDSLCWVDVGDCSDGEVHPGLDRAEALSRFHVRDASGRLIDGGRAFAVLWAALPGFARAGRLLQHPPFGWLLDRAYSVFLRMRPALQVLLARRSTGR